jgi:hypothetical protein
VALPNDMLFVELAKVVYGYLRYSGMIDSKSGIGLGCFGRLIVGSAKGKMENIAGGGELIA